MGGFFKKAFKIFHPVEAKMFGVGANKGDGGKGYMDLGASQARNAEEASAISDYANIPQQIRDQYTSAAKKAGTYADTPEFQQGLGSEVQAGVRGARVEAVSRINALRKAAGNTEEFKPDGFDQTQANNTQDTLAEHPAPEDAAPAATTAPADQPAAMASTSNSAASVQNAAPQKRAFGFSGYRPQTTTSAASRLGALGRRPSY